MDLPSSDKKEDKKLYDPSTSKQRVLQRASKKIRQYERYKFTPKLTSQERKTIEETQMLNIKLNKRSNRFFPNIIVYPNIKAYLRNIINILIIDSIHHYHLKEKTKNQMNMIMT